MVSRARRGRAAQPWLSAVEGAVAKSDPMHAGTRATSAKLRFFTVLGQVVFRLFRSEGWIILFQFFEIRILRQILGLETIMPNLLVNFDFLSVIAAPAWILWERPNSTKIKVH